MLDRVDGYLIGIPLDFCLYCLFYNEKKISILGSTGSIGLTSLKLLIIKLIYSNLICFQQIKTLTYL